MSRNQPTGNDIATLRGGQLIEDNGALDPENDPGNFLDPDEPIPADVALENLRGQLNEDEVNGVRVYPYKVDERTKKRSSIRSSSLLEFGVDGLDKLRDEYGSGEYHIRVMRANRVLMASNVNLLAAPKVIKPVIDIAEVLAQQQATMMAGFERMLTMQRPQRESLGAQDIIGLIAALQPMMNSGGNHPAAPDSLAMVRAVIDMSKELGGGSRGESSDTDIIMKAIETFGQPIAKMVMEKQSIPQPNVLPSLSNPNIHNPQLLAQPQPTPDPDPEPQGDDMNLMVAAYKHAIMRAASNNADPETYAGLVLDNFSPAQINEFFVKPTWFEELKGFVPEAVNYPQWFGELRDTVLEMLQEEQKTASVPGNPNPAPGNAT